MSKEVEQPSRRKPTPAGLAVATVAALLGVSIAIVGLRSYGFGVDSLAYWSAWHHGFYTSPPGQRGAYLYSPAFADVVWPFAQLPWPIFAALWGLVTGAALLWLLSPLAWWWRLPALALVSPEIVVGNVWALFAVVVVIGFARPQAWALPLLTKVAPAFGCLWFAVRREWRQLSIALVWTVVFALVSFAIDPHRWTAWASFLWRERGAYSGPHPSAELLLAWPPQFSVRFVVACVLTVVGAVRGKRWSLAVAVALGSPGFGPENFIVLAALPRLWAARDAASGRSTERVSERWWSRRLPLREFQRLST